MNRTKWSSDEYFKHIAETLIDQFEQESAAWTKAWQDKSHCKSLPGNVATGKLYRGINMIYLATLAKNHGYVDNRWGTYRQVQSVGGQVRRGERGAPIIFWETKRKLAVRDDRGKPVRDTEGNPVYRVVDRQHPVIRHSTVFNALQCDGVPNQQQESCGFQWESSEVVERILKNSGATIVNRRGDRAYFDLKRDCIILPSRNQFPTAVYYYQSALHELGHWTGHPARLNRESLMQGIKDGFGSEEYAREELRAEICSMMLGEILGIGHSLERHASYVGSWVKVLREDPKEIYRAAADAQKISDYILDLAGEQDEESHVECLMDSATETGDVPDLSSSTTAVTWEQLLLFG